MNCPFCNTPVDEHPANRCMDKWVAVLVGWTPPQKTWQELQGQKLSVGKRMRLLAWHDAEGSGHSECAPYSTDIAAAMGALEGWLAIHNRRVCEIDWDGAKGLWGVGLYLSRDPARIPEWCGDAETLRLAICRAIIKAKENEHAG